MDNDQDMTLSSTSRSASSSPSSPLPKQQQQGNDSLYQKLPRLSSTPPVLSSPTHFTRSNNHTPMRSPIPKKPSNNTSMLPESPRLVGQDSLRSPTQLQFQHAETTYCGGHEHSFPGVSYSAPSTPKLISVSGTIPLNKESSGYNEPTFHQLNLSRSDPKSPKRFASPKQLFTGSPVASALSSSVNIGVSESKSETSSLLNLGTRHPRNPKALPESNLKYSRGYNYGSINSGTSNNKQRHNIIEEQIKLPKKTIRDKISYYVPLVSWLPFYTVSDFLGDLIAGISLASFQIPLSLSYATSLAHVPTVCGLYALIIPPIVYSIFGTVPQMIVGPEGAISLVVGQAVEPILKHEGENGITGNDLVVIISAVSGGALLGAGLLKFGFLENVLNGALLNGFISAVGVVMIINGLIEELKLSAIFSKLPGHEHSPVAKVRFLWNNIENAHYPTVIISVVTFSVIIGSRILKRYVNNKPSLAKYRAFSIFFPEILFTVVVTTSLSCFLQIDKVYGIEVLGEIKAIGFNLENPFNRFEDYHGEQFLRTLIGAGYMTAILGFFESTTASKSLSTQLDLEVSPDRELFALGMINICGCFFGALPSFGGYGRSKINALSGAKTTFSGAIMGIVTLIVTIHMLSLIYHLPKCLLSVISTVIGVSLLEEAPSNLMFHWRARGYNELVTFFITIFATLFSSLELGITVGCGYSLLRVIKHSGKSRIETNVVEVDKFDILIVRIPEPLTFTNAEAIRSKMMRINGELNNCISAIVIDISNMASIDSSASQILNETIQKFVRRGVVSWVCGPNLAYETSISPPPNAFLRRLDVLKDIQFANSVDEVLDIIRSTVDDLPVIEDADTMSLYSRSYMQLEAL
ncbi:hypothetical protein DASC09_036380 [Saccharomycopsis crataegensis]|uniref:STAS domain-containing protein n=1 Tax=Saccharomycopsis crataegensis TaxID=43959 RepID=A0AAV5QQ70_9ASCO|nr:hypothetical protein DASC09_036380 [Saccharomycopsis crataegensis]